MGKNWRSTFDRYLHISPASGQTTSVIAERSDGQILTFTFTNGVWTTDSDVDVSIKQAGANWVLTDRDDTVETYSQSPGGEGILNAITTRNGYTQSLSYNSTGQITSVVDSYGRSLSFTYQSGLLQTLSTPDNTVFTYGYTSSGATFGVLDRLSSVSYSTTPSTTLTYLYEKTTFPLALTGITDENGSRYTTWTYDSYGRATSSQQGSNVNYTIVSYDDTTGNRTVTNALGEQEVYKFVILQGVPKLAEIDRLPSSTTAAAKRLFTYDSNGYVASQTDWNGNLTTFVNDNHGRPTSMTEAVGYAQARTTTTTYHLTFHLPLTISTPGLNTSFTYDASGNVLAKTLTDTTNTIAPYATTGTTRTWTYTWSNSLLSSVKGPRADVTQMTNFAYDGSGALVSITDALGHAIQITQHLGGGLPLAAKDANGVTTTYSYDGRLRSLTSTMSTTTGPLTTQYAYDAAGNLLKTSLPDGSFLLNNYDAAHRLYAVVDPFNQFTFYSLDALGDHTQSFFVDNTGTAKYGHFASFDALGRKLQDVGAAGQTAKFTYDSTGNALTVIDPLGNTRQQTFDALNRLIRVIDPVNGITKTTYDAHDRPVTVVDANSGSTTYIYDGFGDILQLISPDSGKTVYRYDLAGNLVQKVDATGATTNYTYDALDRQKSISYPADPSENVAYTYDESGHGFGVGRMTSVTDAAGSLGRSFDERGNILSESRTHGSATLSTSYTYDGANRIASIRYPSGWRAIYSRDIAGRIAAVSAQTPGGALQPVVSGVTYRPFGPTTGLTYGNGVSETRNIDLDYHIGNIVDVGTSTLQSLSYLYDYADNIHSITDGVTPGNNQTFGYDALNRLTSATGAYGPLAYTYNAIGNRLAQTSNGITTTYGYAAHSNQLVSVKTGASTTAVGNTMAGNVASFAPALSAITALTYNQANRLSAAAGNSGQVTQYTYDGFGQRLLKVGVTTGTTLYQYESNGLLLEEADGQGNAKADYIYLNGIPVATIQPSNNQVYFLHSDRLGTPQLVTDSNKSVQWAANYQPFGATNTGVGLIVQDVRLPGQELDLETGFYHNGVRDYVPTFGRYLESDPLGLTGGMNSFIYANNNPAKYSDAAGLTPDTLSQNGSQQLQNAIPLWSKIANLSQGGYLEGIPAAIGGFIGSLCAPSPKPAETGILDPESRVIASQDSAAKLAAINVMTPPEDIDRIVNERLCAASGVNCNK